MSIEAAPRLTQEQQPGHQAAEIEGLEEQYAIDALMDGPAPQQSEVPQQAQLEAPSAIEQSGPRHRAERDRLTTRIAIRVSNIANSVAERTQRIGDSVYDLGETAAARRTTRQVARDTRESVKSQVEHGKTVAREVGSTVISEYVEARRTVGSSYNSLKAGGREKVAIVRNYFRQKAEAAHERKSALTARLYDRKDRAVAAVTEKASTASERTRRAAGVGKEALKVSGLVALGAGVIAAEAAGRKYTAKKEAVSANVSRKVDATKQIKQDVIEGGHLLHGDVINLRASRVEKKAERKHAKAYAKTQAAALRANRAHDLRVRAIEIQQRAG